MRRILFGNDACLSTLAAPRYFTPHLVDGAARLDGDLVANNADTLVLPEIARRRPQRFARTQMLSNGSAGADRTRATDEAGKPGMA